MARQGIGYAKLNVLEETVPHPVIECILIRQEDSGLHGPNELAPHVLPLGATKSVGTNVEGDATSTPQILEDLILVTVVCRKIIACAAPVVEVDDVRATATVPSEAPEARLRHAVHLDHALPHAGRTSPLDPGVGWIVTKDSHARHTSRSAGTLAKI